MKPNIVFFSRAYQTKFFPNLVSEKYNSVHVTLTSNEKRYLEGKGIEVKYCFEEFQVDHSKVNVPSDYLETSWVSDRFLNKFELPERKKILEKEVTFWENIFDEYKPVIVLNEQVAIEIAEVMHIEAKKRNIRYLAWMNTPVNGYFYWIKNANSLELDEEILKKEISAPTAELVEGYIKNILEKEERPYYIQPFLNNNKFRNLYSGIKHVVLNRWKKVKGNQNFYEDYSAAVNNQLERAIATFTKTYDDFQALEKDKIVLFPLHYEPEASLSYLSEYFSNQVALIENLLKCLKQDQTLVIKEHPAQAGMLLTNKYQRLRKEYGQLKYLPASVSSFKIIRKSELIITLTSHLGWEALILGKPAYLLGKMFYDKYPLVNKFESFAQLKKEIQSQAYVYPEIESVKKYIGQIMEVSFEGHPFPSPELLSEKNYQRIVFALEQELNRIGN